ncbi:Uma2 family endonuclease [Anabaena sp. FACHB-1237]|uniref:Uma2 family endonuclease n=1 Tax=Anabaena sp. FACHB-1237 TaxID=2692769 RepID=UPI0016806867|nr:Uma2 family endonuclease [Anabaena sp. FACHB-1237]MBD2138155.1 Uma2 family endonuclease [Anabaena sp. FACHB-1237]
MVQQIIPPTTETIIYPDSDGKPMADNTKQYQWIVKIKENLEILFASQPDVFIAGDLLWYPIQGSNKICQAPDVMVVFGRPKRDRGSYQQWKENNIAPQVVFEILSPGNTTQEMVRKLLFYQRYGVEEYYIYNPDTGELNGLLRSHEGLSEIEEINGWISPRLGILFQLTSDNLEIYYPDDQKFLTSIELDQLAKQERKEKEIAIEKYQQLLAKLQEKGIDLESL